MKLEKLFTLGFIPNQPEIRINTLTLTITKDSATNCPKANSGALWIVSFVGSPNERKSAWTISTNNMATIRSNSMLDCRVILAAMASFILVILMGGEVEELWG